MEPKPEREGSAAEILRDALAAAGESDSPENRERYSKIAKNIEQQFETLRVSVTEGDLPRILDQASVRIREISASGTGFAARLGRQLQLLHAMLGDSHRKAFDAPWSTISALAAALQYLLNPVDVVPDFLPVVGLFDDLLVVLLCSVLIGSDLKRYAGVKGFDLADYGLS